MAKLNEAGIPSGVLVAPLMPGINDSPEQVEEIVSIAEEAGATFVNGIALHLRTGVREVFMEWLAGAHPELVARYERLYATRRLRAGRRAQADLAAGPRDEPLRRPALQPARAPRAAARGAGGERRSRAPPQNSLF